MDGDFQFSYTLGTAGTGVCPARAELLGLNPRLARRSLYLSLANDTGIFDVSGYLKTYYQGKQTFKMPMTWNSSAVQTSIRPLTGGVLHPHRVGVAANSIRDECLQESGIPLGSARFIAPLALFVTCDSVVWETLIQNHNVGSGQAYVFIGVKSFHPSL